MLLAVGYDPQRPDLVELDAVLLLARGLDDRDLVAGLDAGDLVEDQRLVAAREVHGGGLPAGRQERRAVLGEPEPREQVVEVLVQHPRTVPRLAPLVIALALAACAGRQKPSQSTIDLVDRADAAELKRDHATARQLYEEAIARAPNPASERYARHEFADTLAQWGEIDNLGAQLEAIVALAPNDAAAWHDLGVVRHNQGDDAGAVQALLKAQELAPRDPRPRLALAQMYWIAGDKASALAEYVECRKLDLPDNYRAKVEGAIKFLTTGDPSGLK